MKIASIQVILLLFLGSVGSAQGHYGSGDYHGKRDFWFCVEVDEAFYLDSFYVSELNELCESIRAWHVKFAGKRIRIYGPLSKEAVKFPYDLRERNVELRYEDYEDCLEW